MANAVETVLADAYGEVAPITDGAAFTCQKTIGNSAVRYLKTAAQAIEGCLDARNQGNIVGDGQVLCIGQGAVAGVQTPSDGTTMKKIAKAGAKVLRALQRKCDASALASLRTCGSTAAAVADCITCTSWRQVAAVIRGVYGP